MTTTTARGFRIRRTGPCAQPADDAWLRVDQPVSGVLLPNGSSTWLVTGPAEVRSVLTDPETAPRPVGASTVRGVS
ncbi:hypothetical protein F0L68_39140 [Solihabitans fulvus]|uniref:Uncharacterized protein n=1 Tax=Solihabitans fulvus TaxID=1892852 RepID=A0A5B2WE67_9PSEU|nr:hypothetical protein [Solihabitans fulvus]KAA2250161.1 hypothetical protein F0L68_39140 [Solihabitans fulvus]